MSGPTAPSAANFGQAFMAAEYLPEPSRSAAGNTPVSFCEGWQDSNMVVQVVLGGVVAAAISALVTLWTQSRQGRQGKELLQREIEHQTRDVLRQTYAQLLVAQRGSREASVRLAEAGGAANDAQLAEGAIAAHSKFIDCYHQFNLDSTREMWLEARGLRDVLDAMLELATEGDTLGCKRLVKIARDARQNVERRLRERLGYESLQTRRSLGKYDKVEQGHQTQTPS